MTEDPVIKPLKMRTIDRTIRRMAALVRLSGARRTAMSLGEDPDSGKLGWWVLAVGDDLPFDDFEARDKARELLRETVEKTGIHLAEHIWVWDEANAAQLVITTVPTRKRADTVAKRLRDKGLIIRVSREKI